MKAFFTGVISSFFGFMLAGIVFLFFLVSLVVGVITTLSLEMDQGSAEIIAQDNSVLVISLDYPINEKTSDDPLDHFNFETFEPMLQLGLDEIVENIRRAKTDNRIEGIYLNLATTNQGLATLEAIRNALLDFKESEKWIIAYGEIFSQKNYYLASVADAIYLNPEGYMEFKGISAQQMYFKNALNKLDIDMQVLRGPDNIYKSAVEPFSETKMSENSRLQTKVLIDDIWQHSLEKLSEARNLKVSDLEEIASTLKVATADDALATQLVDKLVYQDQVYQELKTKIVIPEDKSIPFISLGDYSLEVFQPNKFLELSAQDSDENKPQKNKIAIIFAEGSIMSGESDIGIIGSSTISDSLTYARENEDIKAIVLRINSSGGSALASDVMWREVALSSEVKPTYVSFGDIAASGAYYMAAAADKIYAEPNTITGSIGVFALFPNMQGLFENKLGITFDQVDTNANASFGTLSRPLNEAETMLLQKQMQKIYTTFVQHVADGRNLSFEQVNDIAKGRVWSGKAAKDIGLVDSLGGLSLAINDIALEAGVSDYKILKLPKEPNPFDKFMGNIEQSAKVYWIEDTFKTFGLPYQELNHLSKTKGIQARLPYLININ